jgi:hypothetical protein
MSVLGTCHSATLASCPPRAFLSGPAARGCWCLLHRLSVLQSLALPEQRADLTHKCVSVETSCMLQDCFYNCCGAGTRPACPDQYPLLLSKSLLRTPNFSRCLGADLRTQPLSNCHTYYCLVYLSSFACFARIDTLTYPSHLARGPNRPKISSGTRHRYCN